MKYEHLITETAKYLLQENPLLAGALASAGIEMATGAVDKAVTSVTSAADEGGASKISDTGDGPIPTEDKS